MARISAAKRSLDSQLKRCQTEIRFIKELADQLLTDNPIDIKRAIEQAFLNPAYVSLVSKSIRAQEWWSIHLQAIHAADLAFQVQVWLMLALKADAEQLHQKIKKDLAVQEYFEQWHMRLTKANNELEYLKIVQRELVGKLQQTEDVYRKSARLHGKYAESLELKVDVLIKGVSANDQRLSEIKEEKIEIIREELAPLRSDEIITIAIQWSEDAKATFEKEGITPRTHIEIHKNEFIDAVENRMISQVQADKSIHITEEDKVIISDEIISKQINMMDEFKIWDKYHKKGEIKQINHVANVALPYSEIKTHEDFIDDRHQPKNLEQKNIILDTKAKKVEIAETNHKKEWALEAQERYLQKADEVHAMQQSALNTSSIKELSNLAVEVCNSVEDILLEDKTTTLDYQFLSEAAEDLNNASLLEKFGINTYSEKDIPESEKISQDNHSNKPK